MNITCKIYRVEQSAQGAIGALTLFDRAFCSTMEPDDADPDRFQIPEGIYYCRHRIAPEAKYKDTYEILVPGHKDLLFHWGNREINSLGCVILGLYPGELEGDRAVLNSLPTFNRFMATLQGVDWFYTQFINLFDKEF